MLCSSDGRMADLRLCILLDSISDISGRRERTILNGCVQWSLVYPHSAGIEPGTARS